MLVCAVLLPDYFDCLEWTCFLAELILFVVVYVCVGGEGGGGGVKIVTDLRLTFTKGHIPV